MAIFLSDGTSSHHYPEASWQQEALLAFQNELSDQQSRFPCIPATVGLRLGQFRFGFAGDPATNDAAEQLADLLNVYGQQSMGFGPYTSLIVFFDTTKQKELDLDVPSYFRIY